MDGPGATAAVQADQLVKHYDDIEAVRGVDLRIEAGEVFGFLVVAVLGALMLFLNVRPINHYD